MVYPERDIYVFLTEEDGRCRQIVNGVIVSLNKRTPLPEGPEGTEEITILWQRNMEKLIQVRSFSVPMGMVGDGREIVINDSLVYNLNRKLYINFVEQFPGMDDTKFYLNRYKYLYKGQLDMSSVEDIKKESKANVSILEGGIYKLLKAYEAQVYTLNMDNNYVVLENDGILLHKRSTYSAPIPFEVQRGDVLGSIIEFAMPTFTKGTEGVAPGVVLFDQQFEEVADHFDYLSTSSNYSMKLSNSWPSVVNARIKGKFIVQCTSGLSSVYGSLQLRWLKQDGSLFAGIGGESPTGIVKDPEESMQANSIYQFIFDETGTLQPGDVAFLIGQMFEETGVSEVLGVKFLEGSEFTVEFETQQATTYTKMKSGWQVFKELVGKITGDENLAQSDLLQGIDNGTVTNEAAVFLDNGNLIRGVSGASLKTSLSLFAKAYNVYHCAAWGVLGGKIRFEKRGFAFDTTIEPVALGEIDPPTVTNATDLMYTTMKIGHRDQNLSDANSKNDFCGTHNYNFPLNSIEARELDLQTDYKAGPYEREEIRINLLGKPTTADDSDDQIFVADVVRYATQFTGNISFIVIGTINYIILPNTFRVRQGSKIQITGTASNDNSYTVLDVANLFFFGNVAAVSEAIINEGPVLATVTIIDGSVVRYRRDEIPDSGVESPTTVYNVGLRVSKLVETWGRWLKSWLWNFDMDQIEYTSGTVNTSLIVAGKADNRSFVIGMFGERLFIPKYVEFSPAVYANLNDIFEANINRPISVIMGDEVVGVVVGHTWKAGLAPVTKKTQTFKFLCFPNTNVEFLK